MSLIRWTLSNSPWLTLIAAFVTVILRHRTSLHSKTARILSIASTVLLFLTATLSVVKKYTDDWDRAQLTSQLSQLSFAVQPRPFPNRLVDCLQSADNRFLRGLLNGYTNFNGRMEVNDVRRLRKLLAEPVATKYVKVFFTDDSCSRMAADGRMYQDFVLAIDPTLLREGMSTNAASDTWRKR